MRLFKFHFPILLSTVIFSLSHSAAAENDPGVLWVPPGKLINVGTHRLHIYCEGEDNAKPVVIIDSGLGGFSLEWRKIQDDLADEFQICAYDRAGYGWSDPGPFPRTTKTLISELSVLLDQAGLSPPYILVGHSFGGYNMMYFAKTRPDDVAGMVLVDSSHPDQANWFPSVYPDKAANRRRARFISIPKLPANYPADYRTLAYHLMNARKARNALRFESMNFEISAQQVAAQGQFPDIPLVVLSRGERAWPKNHKGNEFETSWIRLQNKLARMSHNEVHVIANFSGHYIHLDQPYLVEDAIRSITEENPCDGRGRLMYVEFKSTVSVSDAGEC